MSNSAEIVAVPLADLQSLIEKAAAVARWMPRDRAAEYSGISLRSLQNLISAGKLQLYRPVKGRVVLDRLELDSYVASTATARPRTGRGLNRNKGTKPDPINDEGRQSSPAAGPVEFKHR